MGCGIITVEINKEVHVLAKRPTPGEIGALRGSTFAMMGLLLLVVVMSAKPLADIVGDYTCYNRHQKINKKIHVLTSSLLPVWRGAAQPV